MVSVRLTRGQKPNVKEMVGQCQVEPPPPPPPNFFDSLLGSGFYKRGRVQKKLVTARRVRWQVHVSLIIVLCFVFKERDKKKRRAHL